MAEKKLPKILKLKTAGEKRTSQGVDHRPKNKHKRKNWTPYRGQGRP